MGRLAWEKFGSDWGSGGSGIMGTIGIMMIDEDSGASGGFAFESKTTATTGSVLRVHSTS